MDKTKRNVAALGVLTVLAIGIFFWGLYYLLGNAVLSGGLDLIISMPNGGGLKRGDRVIQQGVIIGSVRDIQLLGPRGVTAAVRLDESQPLPKDTRAIIAGDVFGAHTVEIIPGSGTVALEDGDTIPGNVAPMLVDQATGLTGTARSVLQRADTLLSYELMANLQATSAMLPSTAEQLRAAFVELRQASAALRRTTEEVTDAKTATALTSAINRIEQGANTINTAAGSLNTTILSLNTSITSMQSVFGKIDTGQGTLGRLVNDTSLYAELYGAAREMRSLAADIRANPKRYLDVRIF